MFHRQLVLPRAKRAARRRRPGQVQRVRIAGRQVRLAPAAKPVAQCRPRVQHRRHRQAFRHHRLSVEKAGRARGHGPERRQCPAKAQGACRLRPLKAVDPADDGKARDVYRLRHLKEENQDVVNDRVQT